MVPSDKALATSYRLLIVIMSLFAAVWPQSIFSEKFSAISVHILEKVTDKAKMTDNYNSQIGNGIPPYGDAENARNENTRHKNAAPYCVAWKYETWKCGTKNKG